MALVDKLQGRQPELAIILGSSLGGLTEMVSDPLTIPYTELEGFPRLSISGHAGKLVVGKIRGRQVAVLGGRAHPYEQGRADVMWPVLQQLREAGVTTLVLTNAAGSLKLAMKPGALMMITDHINFSGMNPLIGRPSDDHQGDGHFVSMTNAYDPDLRKQLLAAAKTEKIALKQGVYCWYSGPSFETPAEIKMFQIIGGSAVGMSTVPETIMARRMGFKVLGLSVITNMAAGIKAASPSHDETKREGQKAVGALQKLLTRFIREHS